MSRPELACAAADSDRIDRRLQTRTLAVQYLSTVTVYHWNPPAHQLLAMISDAPWGAATWRSRRESGRRILISDARSVGGPWQPRAVATRPLSARSHHADDHSVDDDAARRISERQAVRGAHAPGPRTSGSPVAQVWRSARCPYSAKSERSRAYLCDSRRTCYAPWAQSRTRRRQRAIAPVSQDSGRLTPGPRTLRHHGGWYAAGFAAIFLCLFTRLRYRRLLF